MRDDIGSLPLPKSAKAYARMTSKDLGDDWSKKVDMYLKMAGDTSNQGTDGFPRTGTGKKALGRVNKGAKKGFPNIDGFGEKVQHTFSEDLAGEIARAATAKDELLQRIRATWESEIQYGSGRSPWYAVFAVLGRDPHDPAVEKTVDAITDYYYYDYDYPEGEELNRGWDFLVHDVFDKIIEVSEDELWAIERLWKAVQPRPTGNEENPLAESIVSRLLEDDDLDQEVFEGILGQKPYAYATCCVAADGQEIMDMVDQAQTISYETFFRNVPLSEVLASGIAGIYYWTPAQCVAAGVPYEEIKGNYPLTMKKDWHISYHRSVYQGRPCLYFVHSAIEYIFVKV
jgi:hypothetical protein